MLRHSHVVVSFLCAASLLAPATGRQTAAAKSLLAKDDYSQEAFVIEQFSRKHKFEKDGTSLREDTARIRIQSEAGVQQYSVLTFSYASGIGTFEVKYVRVRKPDGSVVETPADNVQDMAAQITREAPFYSDLHEKHIAVKGLGVGDILEFQIAESTTKPLAPGQFWTSYEFTHGQIVLDEQLQISVPRERSIKLKSSMVQPIISEAGDYRVYVWHSSNLQHKDETEKKREATEKLWNQARGRTPRPDVLLSSFNSWEEVGRWYGGLQEERIKPTAEVAAKAAELTKNSADEEAKIRTLYAFVSTEFHYIGIAFGIGRYQPHSAEVVLENRYGDCKDKHTLLAALLGAAGIPSYPALINAREEVDEDVPSPGQFDHVITFVPTSGGPVWLDTTPEVAPYRFLLAPLRDKRALVIPKEKPAELVSTPADLPYKTTQIFNMKAKLNDSGVLEGSADFSARGDLEYLLRAGFRAVPLPQWKDLAQRISFSMGFGGDVSDVTASSPEKTDEPFHFSYKYVRKDFGDWPNHRIVAPEPMVSLPGPKDEEMLPLGPTWLGPSIDVQFHSELELPSSYQPVLPAAIHLKRDFAQYDSTYEFKDGKMICERHVQTLMREVPAAEREQYKEFAKTVQEDYGVFIPLLSRSGTSAATSQTRSGPENIEALRNLPDSGNEEALRLENSARDAVARNDVQSAISSLYRAVAADPQFTRAWVFLGTLLLSQKQDDAGTDAFHKAMAVSPELPAIPKTLGYSLMAADHTEQAIPVWQEFMKKYPDDADGPANLGSCYMRLMKYPEAASQMEVAVKIRPDRPNLQMNLASAYLKAGEREKAAAAYRKVAEMDAAGDYLNDVAYYMADADLSLPLALEYAKKAVRKAEEESQKITLQELKKEDLQNIFTLSAYWDTLGWANERSSDLEAAERFLQASWRLTQDGVVAGHLCRLYERTHQAASAIRMCQMALYRLPLGRLAVSQYKLESDAVQATLDHLTSRAKPKGTGAPSDAVIQERTFKLPRFLTGTESAEFFVLLASDGKSDQFKVEDVKFISGSDKLKLQGKQLRNIDFHVPAPDNVPSRFVRRGILGCYQYTGCSFVLLDPASAQSVN